MPQIDNVISFGNGAAANRRSLPGGEGRRVVKACRDVVARTLPQLLAGLFDKLDDALYELADKSDSDALQTGYFTAMRNIRKDRSRVEREFRDKLLSGYDQLWEGGAVHRPALEPEEVGFLASDLALVGDDELEESLAVNNMISKGENRYHQELYALDQRFESLLSGVEVDNRNNPLAPAAFCNAFRDTIRSIDADIPVKLVIYKLFDRQVMHYVGGLYDEINTLFGQAGIMPKLAAKIRRNPVAPRVHRDRGRQPVQGKVAPGAPGYAGDSAGGWGYEGDADEDIGTEIFAALQQMLNTRRGGLAAMQDTATVASLPVVDTGELLAALSALQHSDVMLMQSKPADMGVAMSSLKGQLAEQLKLVRDGAAHKALGQTDDDTIDVIAMLFEFILDDKTIPDGIKVLLGRLQIPMLKVAIMDKSFFSKKLHPARRLLNNLAHSAVGWSKGNEHGKDSLYAKIESIVKRVLMDFEEDPGVFSRLDEEFSQYLETERRGAEVTEERTTQVTQGKEQLKAAKQQVAEEIESRLVARVAVPEVVSSLLREGWKDVLLLSYLRQGPDSDAWRDNLNLVDRLLWSVEPKTEFTERQELLKDIPQLLKSLREGLTGISYDQHKMAHLLKELQTCHIACLRGNPLDDGMSSPSAAGKEAALLSQPRGESSAAARVMEETQRDSHFITAENLKVGAWVEMKEEDGSETRAKLSWKSDVSDAYVFVNRKGVKVVEMTTSALASVFRQGRIRLLDQVDVPLMDRALDSMMKTMQGQQAGSASP